MTLVVVADRYIVYWTRPSGISRHWFLWNCQKFDFFIVSQTLILLMLLLRMSVIFSSLNMNSLVLVHDTYDTHDTSRSSDQVKSC